jgi:hypothetical protein
MTDPFYEKAKLIPIGGFSTSFEDRVAAWKAIAKLLKSEFDNGQKAMRKKCAKWHDQKEKLIEDEHRKNRSHGFYVCGFYGPRHHFDSAKAIRKISLKG